MQDTEPQLLRDTPVESTEAEVTAPSEAPVMEVPLVREAPRKREAATVHVVGFWKRLLAAAIDFSIVIPASLLMTLLVTKIAGVHLPPSNIHLTDIDQWLDLALRTDPALVTAFVMLIAIGMTYLLVFQIVLGRTLGMRVLRMKVIDVYGERPSPARCCARTAGYLASVATLFLGFLWMGFDSEKRALQDWIAGTYVIRG